MRKLIYLTMIIAVLSGCKSTEVPQVTDNPEVVLNPDYGALFDVLRKPWATRKHQCFPMQALYDQWGEPTRKVGFTKGYIGILLLPIVAFTNPVEVLASVYALTPNVPRQSIWETEDYEILVDHSNTAFCGFKDHILRITVIDKSIEEDLDEAISVSGGLGATFRQQQTSQDVETSERSGEIYIIHESGAWHGDHSFLYEYEKFNDQTIANNFGVLSELSYELSEEHYWVAELEYTRDKFDDIIQDTSFKLSYRYTPPMTRDLEVILEPGIGYTRAEIRIEDTTDTNIELSTTYSWISGITWELSDSTSLIVKGERSIAPSAKLKHQSIETTLSFNVSDTIIASVQYVKSSDKSEENNVDDKMQETSFSISYLFDIY